MLPVKMRLIALAAIKPLTKCRGEVLSIKNIVGMICDAKHVEYDSVKKRLLDIFSQAKDAITEVLLYLM